MDAKTFQAAAGIPGPLAERWVGPVTSAMAEFQIDTPARVAAFIAQCGHESMGFTRTTEIWGPTPAQIRYEGRADLGNLQRGDGSLFRGRGLIQITGRTNYMRAGKALGVDLVSMPRLLEADVLAARSAAWFWSWKELNALADAGDFLAISIRINGRGKDGLPNGWDSRKALWAKAKQALGI